MKFLRRETETEYVNRIEAMPLEAARACFVSDARAQELIGKKYQMAQAGGPFDKDQIKAQRKRYLIMFGGEDNDKDAERENFFVRMKRIFRG